MCKIMFLTNIPSPYRVDFFNELGRYCDLTVLFEKASSDVRDRSWKSFYAEHFTPIFLKGIAVRADAAFCPDVIKYLHRDYDHIVITNMSDLTGVFAISYMRLLKIPYEIESDGGFPKSGKGFKEKLKKWLISGAVRWFSTSKQHDRYYLQYGAEQKRIVRYPFTSLHKSDILDIPNSEDRKAQIRQELGLPCQSLVLSVGRFSYMGGYGKGFDLLIKSASKLPFCSLQIIGQEPTDEFIRLKEEYKADNVTFIGFKSREELKKYYQAADAFILPTRGDVWGLVINEAMANGLPIITTDRCGAGLELVDEKNGAIIKSDSVYQIVKAVTDILSDESKRMNMAMYSIKKIRGYTIEAMVAIHRKEWDIDSFGENSDSET